MPHREFARKKLEYDDLRRDPRVRKTTESDTLARLRATWEEYGWAILASAMVERVNWLAQPERHHLVVDSRIKSGKFSVGLRAIFGKERVFQVSDIEQFRSEPQPYAHPETLWVVGITEKDAHLLKDFMSALSNGDIEAGVDSVAILVKGDFNDEYGLGSDTYLRSILSSIHNSAYTPAPPEGWFLNLRDMSEISHYYSLENEGIKGVALLFTRDFSYVRETGRE